MIYSMCAHSDPGRVRANNEDAVAFDVRAGLCVLADGLGGYNAGEVASRMATAAVQAEMSAWMQQQDGVPGARSVMRELQSCVERLNRRLLAEAQRQPAYRGMASTLVVGVFQGARLILGHVGDSRCYRWHRAQMTQLTRDHSYVQGQIDAGLMTPQQAAVSASRNLVTRALGAGPEVELEVHEHGVEADDVYLMCSDGLSDMVSSAEMAEILSRPLPLAQRARVLVDTANAHGGRDNISVLLVHAAADCRTISPQ
jgi:protein phosphatase